jgi:hypothetical protein
MGFPLIVDCSVLPNSVQEDEDDEKTAALPVLVMAAPADFRLLGMGC